MIKDFIIKNRFALIGGALGAVGGYAYYYFIGCSTGACAITSSPFMSTIWGTAMGALLFQMFEKKDIKTEE